MWVTRAGQRYDVFLSHAGGKDLVVKCLLDFLRRDLIAVPSTDDRPIPAFLDEADLGRMARVRDLIEAALGSAQLGMTRSTTTSGGTIDTVLLL